MIYKVHIGINILVTVIKHGKHRDIAFAIISSYKSQTSVESYIFHY